MPTLKDSAPMMKKTIRLYVGDTEALDQFYPTIGHNKVIRHLVRRHLRLLQERFSLGFGAQTKTQPQVELSSLGVDHDYNQEEPQP